MTDNKGEKVQSFEDLDDAELYRSGVEDFALHVEKGDNRATLLAAFLEQDITWDMYLEQHQELVVDEPKETLGAQFDQTPRETEKNNPNVITAKSEPATTEPGGTEGVPVGQLRVQEPLRVNPQDTYLIKMVRGNVLYETRGYKFTQDHPYALVNAGDAAFILEEEDGFRQALPSEVAEFYG